MLLYDRLQEHVARYKDQPGLGRLYDQALRHGAIQEFVRGFDSAVVFDLTGVLPLVGSWEESAEKPLPRRPPFETTWCEWVHDDTFADKVYSEPATEARMAPILAAGLDGYRMRAGFLNARMDVEATARLTRKNREHHPDGSRLEGCESIVSYGARYIERFYYRSGCRPHPDYPSGGWTAPLGSACLTLTPYTPEGVVLRPMTIHLEEPYVLPASVARQLVNCPDHLVFFTPLLVPATVDDHKFTVGDHDFYPWPVVMAFTLLHCKNVVTETTPPDPKVQRHVEKAGMPPRSSFKTLKLVLPATVRKKAGDDVEGAEPENPGVRFHLCRGHYKHLTHPRYRSPGLYWWASHWRGSQEAGEVLKDYAVRG